MTARAEGFWWVRSTGLWFVAQLLGGRLLWSGSTATGSPDSDAWKWGPYLGKEPGDFLAAIVAYVNEAAGSTHAADHNFRDLMFKLTVCDVGSLRDVVDQGRRIHERSLPARAVLTTVADVDLEDVDHYPERNSDKNRKLYGAPDGWDLVWWKCIKVGDVVRYREGPRFSGDRERVHEGTVELVDALGPTIRIAGITGFNPAVDPMAWLRKQPEVSP